MNSKRVVIVGGGIVGLATAWRLTERFPGARVCVLEKEAGVGRHQTGHNSGVLHCGLYYKPGSVKARLAVTGIRQMVEFCRENGVPHEICGKLVVAVDDTEVTRLRALHERGIANGLAGLRWMTRGEMRETEPHVGGVAALHVPQEGIVDYGKVCDTLAAHHRGRVRGRFPDHLRGAAIRPRGRAGRRTARHAHPPLPRRVLQDPPGAPTPGAPSDLPRPRPAVPVPRRPLHAPDSRRH